MIVDIKHNVIAVRERMKQAAERAGRPVDDVTLVAVTKTQPVESILAVIEVGVTNLGENRIQEAMSKFAALDSTPAYGELVPRGGITLHLIGNLQRNKAKQAVRYFDCIHSVDRISLLDDLDAAVLYERGGDPLPVLLEVNVTGEANKAGVPVPDLPRLAEALGGCPNLHGVGLMTIARMGAEERELRDTFATLRGLLEDLRSQHPGEWRHLSMGMSDDFEYAIEEGATMVRVGRALFGERVRQE